MSYINFVLLVQCLDIQQNRYSSQKTSQYSYENDTKLGNPDTKNIIIGGDLNGHVGARRDGYESAHGGRGYGTRNNEGESILNAATAYDLAVANTFFKKREEHRITSKSAASRTQIDYFLVHCSGLQEVRNCKVIPGDSVAPQHRILVLDIRLKAPLKPRKKTVLPKVKWWELNNKEKRAHCVKEVAPQLANIKSSELTANDMWQAAATTLLNTAKTLLRTTKGGKLMDRETWWWNAEVQAAVSKKKALYKNWQRSRQPVDRNQYLEAKRAAKQTIATAKTAHYSRTRISAHSVYQLFEHTLPRKYATQFCVVSSHVGVCSNN